MSYSLSRILQYSPVSFLHCYIYPPRSTPIPIDFAALDVAMNWTGGRLQRASGPADTSTTRQKQHFAKAKANILKANLHKANLFNGLKITPMKEQSPDVLQEHTHKRSQWSTRRLAEALSQTRDVTASTDPKRRANDKQDILRIGGQRQIGPHNGAFNNNGHRGRQPKAHRRRSDENGNRNVRQVVNEAQYRSRSPRLDSKDSKQDARRASQFSTYFNHSPHRVPSAPIKKELVVDDDLYDATPPPRHGKQKRQITEQVSDLGSEGLSDTDEAILAKRHRLMLNRDWTGVGFQRPPKHTFVAVGQQDNVAKRRRIKDGDYARYNSRQAIITSPFLKRSRAPLIEPGSARQSPRVNLGRTDVRISIGGKEIPPGISSSSVHSKRIDHRHRVSVDRPETRSSDVMLLDNEDRISCGIESHRRLGTREVKCYDDNRREYYSLYEHPGLPLHHHPLNEARLNTLSQSSRSQDHRSHDSKERHSARRVSSTNERGSIQPQDRRHSQRNLTSGIVGFPRHPKHMYSGDVKFRRPGSTRNSTPIYSSSVSLHHPKPQTSRVASILRSGTSDIDESTVAQIGREKPVVPSSQVPDNEAWESWLAPLLADSSEAEPEQSDTSQRASISPGISAAPTYRYADERTLSEIDQDVQNLESPEPYEEDSDTPFSPAFMLPLDPSLLKDSTPERESNTEEAVESTNAKQTHQEFTNALPTVAPPKPTPKATALSGISKHVTGQENDDQEIWKKFVFDSGSDESEPQLSKSASPAPAGKSKYASLMRAHLAVVNSTEPRDFASPRTFTTPARHTSSSHLTSRMPNSRHSHSESKRESSHTESGPVDSSSAREAVDSIRASGGSSHSWGSNSGLATVAATVFPRPSPETRHASDNVGFRMQKRVIFTKPKPFVGSKSNTESSPEAAEPLHIGRGPVDRGEGVEASSKWKERERDIYSLIDSDEDRDELESIEDD